MDGLAENELSSNFSISGGDIRSGNRLSPIFDLYLPSVLHIC